MLKQKTIRHIRVCGFTYLNGFCVKGLPNWFDSNYWRTFH